MIRKVHLITPNIPNRSFNKHKNKNLNDMIKAANILLKFGVKMFCLKVATVNQN